MARVTAKQRKKTKARTGSSKFPMETGAQVESAIKMRGHSKATKEGKAVSASTVLRRASAAVSRLLSARKIGAGTAKELRQKIKDARARDRRK